MLTMSTSLESVRRRDTWCDESVVKLQKSVTMKITKSEAHSDAESD